MKKAVISLSGGMDSTGLLVHLLSKGYEVYCLSFYYGQKHRVELSRANANAEYLKIQGYKVHQMVSDISGAMSVFDSALTSDVVEVPEPPANGPYRLLPETDTAYSVVGANPETEIGELGAELHTSSAHAVYIQLAFPP